MIKSFNYIKHYCKTSNQMRCFNHLLSTFSTGDLNEPTGIIKAILPMSLTKEILEECESKIKSDDLVLVNDATIHGREYDTHITFFIGNYSNEFEMIINNIELNGHLPIKCKIESIETFDKDDYKCVHCVINSPELINLHDRYKKTYNITETYDTYKPHITLAYVKPDFDMSVFNNSKLIGKEFNITEFIYSNNVKVGNLSYD